MRLRWTHVATVFGERQVGENEVGTAQTVTDRPVLELPCRLHSSREEIDLDETGARIEREPYAVCPPHGYAPTAGYGYNYGSSYGGGDEMHRTVEIVTEGMDIALTDRALTSTDERLQVLSIDMERGRGHTPGNVVLGLERLSGDAGGS